MRVCVCVCVWNKAYNSAYFDMNDLGRVISD